MSDNNGNGNNGGRKPEETMIFVHLPKTAGTTLNRLIEYEYRPFDMFTVDPYFIHWSNAKLRRLSPERLKKFKVFKGHMGFGLHQLLPQPSTYITVLREPVDRAISTYYFMSTYLLHPMYPKIKRLKWTLEDFITKFPRNNIQCKYLANLDWDATVTPETCELAKSNLEKYFSVVGITERFKETLALLKLRFGWKLAFYTTFNRTRKRPEKKQVQQATLDLIREYNKFDIELYEHGKKLFQASVEKHQEQITAIVADLRKSREISPAQSTYQYSRAVFMKAVNRLYSAV